MIQGENLEDESLRLSVLDTLEERVVKVAGEALKPPEVSTAAAVALCALQSLYEHQGLELAAFITGTEDQSGFDTVQDAVRNALSQLGVRPKRQAEIGDAVLRALHGVFYSSTDDERLYLGKLSRTYALLFTLNAEPRLVSYFQEMAGDFYLYVGSDVLVRALSERFLDEKDQQQRNVLRLAVEAGATLVLTEPVLEEVLGNLRVSDNEFRDYFEPLDGLRIRDAELQSPRILVRAYFHAADDERLGLRRPRSWSAFVNQFVDHASLHSSKALGDLKGYLVGTFGMVFEGRSELESLVDGEELASLTEALTELKKDRALAKNDALLALAVYGRRLALGEESTITEFGYRTWWLTSEARILRHTKAVVARHQGSRYMLRPEFLLNFLAFAPSAADVRETYRNIFPTVLGVKLAKRMDERVFHSLMEKVREGGEVEPGRRKAQMAQLADRMKGDFRKTYLHGFQSEG